MKIKRIYFAQGQGADEALEVYNEKGIDATIDYLSQWDDPDSEGFEVFNEYSAGTSDRTFDRGEYRLTINQGLGYIGLERIL